MRLLFLNKDRCHYYHPSYDDFDLFIMREFPFFKYIIDNFYKNCKSNELRLECIAKPGMIEHPDEALLFHVKNKSVKSLREVKELYIYIIEQKLAEQLGLP